MKIRILALFIIGIFTLMTLISLNTSKEKFYYAFDKKVVLVDKPNTILVKYIQETDKNEMEKIIKKSISGINIKWHNHLLSEIKCKSEKDKQELKSKLKQKEEVITCLPFYTLKDGSDMGVTDEILIRFLPEIESKMHFYLSLALYPASNDFNDALSIF